jgi:hypothetical protein
LTNFIADSTAVENLVTKKSDKKSGVHNEKNIGKDHGKRKISEEKPSTEVKDPDGKSNKKLKAMVTVSATVATTDTKSVVTEEKHKRKINVTDEVEASTEPAIILIPKKSAKKKKNTASTDATTDATDAITSTNMTATATDTKTSNPNSERPAVPEAYIASAKFTGCKHGYFFGKVFTL